MVHLDNSKRSFYVIVQQCKSAKRRLFVWYIISFCHELLCILEDFLTYSIHDRWKEMPVKQMSPSFPPFNLDLMRFTPCIMLIWWELDRGSRGQMRVMIIQDLTSQKPKLKTRPFKNLSHWFDEILAEERGLMDKWYIDATKLFLLATMPETPLQMTIKTQKSSGQKMTFKELYLSRRTFRGAMQRKTSYRNMLPSSSIKVRFKTEISLL